MEVRSLLGVGTMVMLEPDQPVTLWSELLVVCMLKLWICQGASLLPCEDTHLNRWNYFGMESMKNLAIYNWFQFYSQFIIHYNSWLRRYWKVFVSINPMGWMVITSDFWGYHIHNRDNGIQTSRSHQYETIKMKSSFAITAVTSPNKLVREDYVRCNEAIQIQWEVWTFPEWTYLSTKKSIQL